MSKHYTTAACLLAALSMLNACSSDNGVAVSVSTPELTPGISAAVTPVFPTDDGARKLSNTSAIALQQLLAKVKPAERALGMGETVITDEQFAEIKDFVDKNLVKKNAEQTYKAIFSWIVANVKYAYEPPASLDPYDVFINKRCVCQGYANLLKTMCLTQGIPAFCVNGMLGRIGAHAWNYVYVSNRWIVSDPTNNGQYNLSDSGAYKDYLMPYRADITLFEDDFFTYDFTDSGLNIAGVKDGVGEMLTLPFSVSGFRVTNFAPHKALPATVKQLCLGKNITSLGPDEAVLGDYTPGVESIFVDAENPTFEVSDNVLYRKGAELPTYIPTATTRVVLKPMKTVGKNVVVNLPELEELVIGAGTETIGDYAVENCPKLRRVYVPETVTSIAPEAFCRCGDNVEIIRTTTGIDHVTM